IAPIEDLLLEIKNSKHLKGLKLVQKNAKYLHEMISRLLEFRNSNLNVNELNLEEQHIVKPIKQWVQQYQPLAKHKGIRLSMEIPQTDFLAFVDLQKLHIIFNNLVSNALKYCKPKDQISIELVEKAEEFILIVSDNGPGIPHEDQERIFNWYYQSGENSLQQGAGIGLALTKRLVKDLQGNIDVVSQPGKSSTFSIVIPKKSTEIKTVSPQKSMNQAWIPQQESLKFQSPVNFNLDQNKEVLLIIDDNPQILEYLDNLLNEKYDIIYASNGQEGLEKATRYIPDLIISDIMMPEKDGIELCGVLKENQGTTHIPVILLSAKDSAESITSGFGK